MNIEAYACQHCESIYKTQQKAVACEKKCVARNKEEIAEQERKDNLETLMHYVRLNAESVEDVCKLSKEVSEKLFPKSTIKDMKLRVGYSVHASNSHSSPFGGVSNFSPRQNPEKPKGYPALTGTIKVVFNKEPKGFSSDVFDKYNGIAGINTGSGGYRGNEGGYTVEYGVTLWLNDFPKIKDRIEKQLQANEDYETLRKSLYEEYTDAVSCNEEINASKKAMSEWHKQIATLQAKVREEETKIAQVKESIGSPKQDILNVEYEKTLNDFGLPSVTKNLCNYWSYQ
jgi:hypothetical protein